ncbi:MAG: adenylyl-sulfate kinase, partial [Alphaproteobacteria bacterium]
SWRILATSTTMMIIYICTGEIGLSVAVGGLDVVIKMTLYYFHERAWNKIYWGRSHFKPFVLWFTGLPGSGKSTLANALEQDLKNMKVNFEKLDGDVIRKVFPETGYSKTERNNHIRRVGHLASMLEKRGVVVINSFISPYKESREFVRKITHQFIEIHLSAPLEVCEKRDPKGYYKKARTGEMDHFTGISDPYEVPATPEITIDTTNRSVKECTDEIFSYLKKKRLIS